MDGGQKSHKALIVLGAGVESVHASLGVETPSAVVTSAEKPGLQGFSIEFGPASTIAIDFTAF
jgi:hypothetical protein